MKGTAPAGFWGSFLDQSAKVLGVLKTPLQGIGLVVLFLLAFNYLVFQFTGSGSVLRLVSLIGSFLLLALVVLTLGRSMPREITPLSSQDDLPSEDERRCWTGRWQCRWTYRTRSGELRPYVDDVVSFNSIDPATGRLEGTGLSAYRPGTTYNLNGTVSSKRIAHVMYSSPPPRSGLTGMAILCREDLGGLFGWWIGAGRQGGDIGGHVSMTRLSEHEEGEVQAHPVQDRAALGKISYPKADAGPA